MVVPWQYHCRRLGYIIQRQKWNIPCPDHVLWRIQNRHCHLWWSYGDVYFVRFLRIQLYKITRKLLQNVFCIDSAHFFRSGQKFPWRSKVGSKLTLFGFLRTCHHPIREGIDQKLKYRQKPYKMKDWKKCHNSNVLQSIFDKKSSRIVSTRSVVLDRFQSVLIGNITKNVFFP